MHLVAKFGDPSLNPVSKLLRGKVCFYLNRFDPNCPWRSKWNSSMYNPIQINPWRTEWWPQFYYFKSYCAAKPVSVDLGHFDPKWPWRSRSDSTIYNPIGDLTIMHLIANIGGPYLNRSTVIAQTSSFSVGLDSFDLRWPWRSRSNHSIYNPNREPP